MSHRPKVTRYLHVRNLRSTILISGRSRGLMLLLLSAACSSSTRTSSDTTWVASPGSHCDEPKKVLHSYFAERAAMPGSDPDAALARMSRDIPGGFGGVFEQDGKTFVLLKERGSLDSAVSALRRVPEMAHYDLRHPVFKQARWTMDELFTWYRYIGKEAASSAILSEYIDQPRNRIVVSVADSPGRISYYQKLQRLDVPCYLIEVVIRPSPRLTSN